MKKNASIHIKLTTEQKKEVEKKAEKSGLSLSSYILFIILNTKPKVEYVSKN
jgi:uncharacterized protein (DUF1778 family)